MMYHIVFQYIKSMMETIMNHNISL
jgi:hypothetical protein